MSIYNELLQQELIENFPLFNTDTEIHNLDSILSRYNISIIAPYDNEYMDLQEKIKLFLTGKKLEGLSEITLKGYRVELALFTKHVKKKANDVTTNDVRMYLSKWNKLKTSSLSKRISILKSFFGWLLNEEIITKDPAHKIKTPKKEKRLPKALNIEELEMVRESCASLRERAMLECFYATGARLSEIYNIDRFKDIDWREMTILVVGKGNKQRKVYFGYKAIFHLKKYINSRTDDDSALFTTIREPYHRLSMRGIQREIGVIAKRSGIVKNLHVHTLRHTTATLLLNNGCDLSTVQEILGHCSSETTNIYCQVTDEHINQTYKKCFVQ